MKQKQLERWAYAKPECEMMLQRMPIKVTSQAR